MAHKKIEGLERYLDSHIDEVITTAKSDYSLRLSIKMEMLLKSHLNKYNDTRSNNYGLRRYLRCELMFFKEILRCSKITQDQREKFANIDVLINMQDDDLFELVNSEIKNPPVEEGKKLIKVNFPPLDEELVHVLIGLKDLLGLSSVSDVIRLLIFWIFLDSEYFRVYKFDAAYNREYYFRKLKPYLKEDDGR